MNNKNIIHKKIITESEIVDKMIEIINNSCIAKPDPELALSSYIKVFEKLLRENKNNGTLWEVFVQDLLDNIVHPNFEYAEFGIDILTYDSNYIIFTEAKSSMPAKGGIKHDKLLENALNSQFINKVRDIRQFTSFLEEIKKEEVFVDEYNDFRDYIIAGTDDTQNAAQYFLSKNNSSVKHNSYLLSKVDFDKNINAKLDSVFKNFNNNYLPSHNANDYEAYCYKLDPTTSYLDLYKNIIERCKDELDKY